MLNNSQKLTPAARQMMVAEAWAEAKRRTKQAQRRAEAEGFIARYRTPNGIVRFVYDVLGVQNIAPYQADILRALIIHKRVAVRGPHGLGKTALASWVVLWGMACFDRDTKIPTTASAWRQLEKFLWPEIRKWGAGADWSKVGLEVREGRELLQLHMKLPGKEAFALASDNPALLEGAHASRLLYVFDESKTIPDPTWDAAEGAFSTAGDDTEDEAYALAISTPGAPVGRFYDIHTRKPGLEDWYPIHVTLEQAIAAGRISADWADRRRRQWGETSAVYQNRVLGNFASSAEDSVIPLAWIEAAHQRWYEWVDAGKPGDFWGVGVDVGRGGDYSILAPRYGNAVDVLRIYNVKDTMAVTGFVTGLMSKYRQGRAVVDVIGIGAGVVDRLREMDRVIGEASEIDAFNAGEGVPTRRDSSGELGFVDRRSAAWWNLRELLDPANGHAIALPPDEEIYAANPDIDQGKMSLVGDLTAPRWEVRSGGTIKVEKKEDIKKRLGRSTDAGDSVVQVFDDVPGNAAVVGGTARGLYKSQDRSYGRRGVGGRKKPGPRS